MKKKYNHEELVGSVVGLLHIDGMTGKYFICTCFGCGRTNYKRRKDAFYSKTQNVYSCGCKQNQPTKSNKVNWSGYKDLTGHQFSRWRTGARRRNLVFDITPQVVWDIYESQNRLCPITGEGLYFYNKPGGQTNLSIDRKNNAIGYTIDNIWLTHVDFNKFHHTYSLERVLELSRLITNPAPHIDNTTDWIPSWFFISVKRNARLRTNIYFDITKDDILNKFNKQCGCCYYTGLPLKISSLAKNRKNSTTASIDRLDSSLGYSPDNIVWCLKEINMMKKDLSEGRFRHIASKFQSL